MEKRNRIAIGAAAVAIGIAGSIYGGWALLNYILNADALTKFLIAASASGAGLMGAKIAGTRE